VRTRIPRAFKCWWSPSSARWFSVSSSSSLRASKVCALATHQIWTNKYRAHRRLRVYARWLHACIPQVMCIEPSAGCLRCQHSFPPLAYKAPTSWWSLIETKKQISGGGNFFGTMRKKSVRDDYVRLYSQLVVWKCLSFVFLHSHLKGLF